jgi:hypothetical protein
MLLLLLLLLLLLQKTRQVGQMLDQLAKRSLGRLARAHQPQLYV